MASKERQLLRWHNIQQPVVNSLKCYVCDYENHVSTYKTIEANDMFNAGKLIRYKCPNCDVIFGDLRFLSLSETEIQNDYEDLYSYYSESDTTKYILEVLQHLDIFKDKNLRYLDYACGKWNAIIPKLKNASFVNSSVFNPFNFSVIAATSLSCSGVTTKFSMLLSLLD